jgi:hypothetical protein
VAAELPGESDARAGASRRAPASRLFRLVAGGFAVLALWDLYVLATGPVRSAVVTDLIMHLAMATAFATPAWAGGAPPGSRQRRIGTLVSIGAVVAMAAALAWRVSGR